MSMVAIAGSDKGQTVVGRQRALEQLVYDFAEQEHCRADIQPPREVATTDTLMVVLTAEEVAEPPAGMWDSYAEDERELYLFVPSSALWAAETALRLYGLSPAYLGTWSVDDEGTVEFDL